MALYSFLEKVNLEIRVYYGIHIAPVKSNSISFQTTMQTPTSCDDKFQFLLPGTVLTVLPSFRGLIRHHFITVCTLGPPLELQKICSEFPFLKALLFWLQLSGNNVYSLLFFALFLLCDYFMYHPCSPSLPVPPLMTRAAVGVLIQVRAHQMLQWQHKHSSSLLKKPETSYQHISISHNHILH